MQNETGGSILSRSMSRQSIRFRSIRVIVTSVGLVLLVSLALGWLGWRLLAQEKTLQNQQAHNRLEQSADVLLAGFLRRMAETEAWLSRIGPALHAESDERSQGGLLVSFSKAGMEVQPRGQLLYRPAVPSAELLDVALFAETEKLEFQTSDFKTARAALSALTMHQDGLVRAEALLRLARVQNKSGQTSEALNTYAKLANENRMSSSEAPYALLSRFARCELLAASHQETAAKQEASLLVASLESGEWPVGKESFAWYDSRARKLAGQPAESRAPEIKLAVAEAVEAAWDEWQLFQRSGSRSLTKHRHRSAPSPVLTIVNANPERMVSLIYAGEALRHLTLDLTSIGEGTDIRASVTEEHGQPLFAGTVEPTAAQVRRSLSAADLPWQLNVTASSTDAGAAFPAERRNYLIAALAAIVLLVGLACYAMARGVLREAAAGQLQSDFVSAVSHEFRSPLTTLRQLTELLAEGRIHEESRRRRYFSVLQQETSRLHQLVEDLLDFGCMDAGRRQYKFEPLDFSELVQDGIEEYQRQAGANGHKIEIHSDHSRLLIDADREALRRVVRNLMENAVKYSPEAKTVWVETGCEGHAAILRVRDEGIGIPPEEKSRIFEKFVRGEAAKKACIPGTGIGLAMVKEIVTVHHGELDLSSEVGHGSTFSVRLPLSNTVPESSS